MGTDISKYRIQNLITSGSKREVDEDNGNGNDWSAHPSTWTRPEGKGKRDWARSVVGKRLCFLLGSTLFYFLPAT